MTPPPRWALAALLVTECLGIAWLVLNPSPATPTATVLRLSDLLFRLGFPDRLADPDLVEFGLNVLLFIPLAALSALLWPRRSFWFWILLGFALSSTLEWLQLQFLADRSSTSRDIIANTMGAAFGAAGVALRRFRADPDWRRRAP